MSVFVETFPKAETWKHSENDSRKESTAIIKTQPTWCLFGAWAVGLHQGTNTMQGSLKGGQTAAHCGGRGDT